jgi:PAS domain S-box-containing protein
MAFQITPTLVFQFSTACLGLMLVFYLFKQNKGKQHAALIALMFAMLVWSVGALIAYCTRGNASHRIWYQFSQTGLLFIPLLWLAFIFQWSGKKDWLSWKTIGVLAIVPVAAVALLWTNPLHFLFWQTADPDVNALGPASKAVLTYNCALALSSIAILYRRRFQPNGRISERAIILMITVVIVSITRVVDVVFLPNDTAEALTGFAFFLSIVLFIIGMFYYRMMAVISIPAHSIIAGMQDGILVISCEHRVAQANLAAEAILGKSSKQLMNQRVEDVFAGITTRSQQSLSFSGALCEVIQLESKEGVRFLEIRQLAIQEQRRHQAGWLIALRDITAQVQAENASRQSQVTLKQSEELFRSLVENINEVIFIVSADGTITYISPAVEQLAGYRAEELIGKRCQQFIYPDDLAGLDSRPLQQLGDQRSHLEFRIVGRRNLIRHVRAYTHVLMQQGSITGIQGVLTDITEQKQVEEALERRASQLAMLNFIGERIAAVIELDSLFNSAVRLIQKNFGYYHVGIFTPDPRWNMLIMRSNSGAFSDLFPENHRLMLGQGMVGWAAEHKTTLLANDVRLEARYANLYPDKIPTRSELAVPILAGDELMGVLDLQSPLVNAFDDNDVRVMKTVADQIAVAMEKANLYEEVRLQLKERERRENMLRIQRDLLFHLSPAKSLQETLQVAVETFSTELHASQVSMSLVDMENANGQIIANLGYPINPGTGITDSNRSIPAWVVRHGQAALIKNVRSDPRRPEVFPGTLSMLSVPLFSSGKVMGVISLESSAANAFSQDDERLLTILANSLVMLIERARLFEEVVTARAELEKRAAELEDANSSLREVDRLKTQFLANMSHELRTPLNSIIGFSEVLVDELIGAMNEEQNEYAQDILDSGRHLLKLINDLLDFSKINAGRMLLEPSVFEVAKLFEELKISVLPQVQKKKQVLVFQQDDQSICLNADRLRIKQVLMNLLSNANKFTAEGGCIQVSCQMIGAEQALFSVRDNGIGINPEDQQFIFEEFRQVDGSMTREVPGTGLGLAISKRIVEIHQGRIWVESEAGQGSTFHVRLPVTCQPILEHETPRII